MDHSDYRLRDHKSSDEGTSTGGTNTTRVADGGSYIIDLGPPLPTGEARRTFGNKFGAGLGSFLTKTAPDLLLSPGIVANEIRRLCRHDKTTLIQRHKDGGTSVDAADRKTLEALCLKLVLFTRRWAHFGQFHLSLTEEYTALDINDPLLRSIFQWCIVNRVEQDLAHLPDPLEAEDIHNRWSDFIGDRIFRNRDETYMQSCCEGLKSTLSVASNELLPRYAPGYLGSAYLSYALALELTKRGLDFLVQLWDFFLHKISGDLHHGGWHVLNTCVENILSSGKDLEEFLSPSQLTTGSLSGFLVRNVSTVPSIFTTFFSEPTIKFHGVGRDVTGVELSYPSMPDWNLPQLTSYACPFLRSATLHPQDDVRTDIDFEYYLRNNSLTSSTVFASQKWMGLYRVADYAISNYYHRLGLSGKDGLPESTQDGLLVLAVEVVKDLRVRLLNTTRKNEIQTVKALASFYVTQSVDVDRYCKRTVHQILKDNTADIEWVNSYSRYMNRIQVVNGLAEFSFIPLFRNVPYLRRFRTRNYETYFTSDNLPESPEIFRDSQGNLHTHLTVDTMLLDGHTLVCIGIDGRESGFDSTGHYPILGGYDILGWPLYVAAIHLEYLWYFTGVEEGAKVAKYNDELGTTHATTKFFVLALRYDPSDTPPPYLRARKGAMDPTGPVSWLKLWPEKDPDYFEDARLIADDDRLTSFLDGISDHDAFEHEILSGFPLSDFD